MYRRQYNLCNGHALENTSTSKYLGVTFNEDLSWKYHVNQTVTKGSRSIGFLRRNLRGCTQQVKKAQAYTTLVRYVLEYASTVCDPYTHRPIHQIEMVQHQAARFRCGNYYSRYVTCPGMGDSGNPTSK